MKIPTYLAANVAASANNSKGPSEGRRDNPLAGPPGANMGDASPVAAGAEAAPDMTEMSAEQAEAAAQGDLNDPESIRKAAREFESYFLSHMLKVMRDTIPEGGVFEKGFSNDVYTNMLDKEYSKLLSDHGGIGLAAVLERQLLDATGAESGGEEG